MTRLKPIGLWHVASLTRNQVKKVRSKCDEVETRPAPLIPLGKCTTIGNTELWCLRGTWLWWLCVLTLASPPTFACLGTAIAGHPRLVHCTSRSPWGLESTDISLKSLKPLKVRIEGETQEINPRVWMYFKLAFKIESINTIINFGESYLEEY
jgi:hypothetical protein